MQEHPATSLKHRALRKMVTTLAVLIAILFSSAGSWRFWQGWLFVGFMAAFWTYFFLDLIKHSPELMERRLRREETNREQKLFQRLFGPTCISGLLLAGFDFRFGWSRTWFGAVPVTVVLIAQGLAVIGYCFVFWVLKTNAFASSTIQVERDQCVIDSGPYALVRHPMYLGMITMALASPLALGSYIALPIFALLVPVLVYRLIHEERTLRRDLTGYSEYCMRCRYRLVPYFW
jgi:protein-S-isoprenylcysteine O-methyltransferase Ste14